MNSRLLLTDWVKLQHHGQLIKKTADPYFNHLRRVAEMADRTNAPLGYEIGLCHDLLEDTEITLAELQAALGRFSYHHEEANYIVACVIELTDVYTKKAYPQLKKTKRKEREASRLIKISPAAQTVKYADLMDNINWVLKHGRKKALPYLQKKRLLLLQMNKGDDGLRTKAIAMIEDALRGLTPM